MVPKTKNLYPHLSGDTWRGVTFTLRTKDSSGNISPIDLTGARVDMHVKKEAADVSSVLVFSTDDSSIQITDALGGVITIPPKVVERKAQQYFFDLQVTFQDGTVTTYVQGSWEIVQDVTRLKNV